MCPRFMMTSFCFTPSRANSPANTACQYRIQLCSQNAGLQRMLSSERHSRWRSVKLPVLDWPSCSDSCYSSSLFEFSARYQPMLEYWLDSLRYPCLLRLPFISFRLWSFDRLLNHFAYSSLFQYHASAASPQFIFEVLRAWLFALALVWIER